MKTLCKKGTGRKVPLQVRLTHNVLITNFANQKALLTTNFSQLSLRNLGKLRLKLMNPLCGNIITAFATKKKSSTNFPHEENFHSSMNMPKSVVLHREQNVSRSTALLCICQRKLLTQSITWHCEG